MEFFVEIGGGGCVLMMVISDLVIFNWVVIDGNFDLFRNIIL